MTLEEKMRRQKAAVQKMINQAIREQMIPVKNQVAQMINMQQIQSGGAIEQMANKDLIVKMAQTGFSITRTESVALTIPSTTQTKIPFPDIPNLRGRPINAIQAYNVDDINVAPAAGGNIVNVDAFKDCFLTLVDINNYNLIQSLPLATLRTATNDGKLKIFSDLAGLEYQKSFIEFSTNANLTPGEVVLFTFYYHEIIPEKGV